MSTATYTGSASLNTGIESTKNAIIGLYKTYRPGEVIPKSAELIAGDIGSTMSVTRKTLNLMAELNLVKKEVGWHKGGRGKYSKYTLLVSQEEALEKINAYNTVTLDVFSKKSRIIALLARGRTYSSPKELSQDLGMNGGSLDLHNLVHVLHALKREHRVTFKVGPTKDKIPYDIKYVGGLSNGHAKDIPVVVPESTPEVIVAPEAPVSVTEPIAEATVSTVSEEFPLIANLIHKSQLLETLTKIAAEAGQEDIAIMVEERMNISDFEREAINLYIAFENCRSRMDMRSAKFGEDI